MTWLAIVALVGLVFAALVWGLKAPRSGHEAIIAALMVGIAGYAAQGHPGQPGAPKAPAETANPRAIAAVRQKLKMGDDSVMPSDKRLVIARALSENGDFAEAVTVLRGATDADPKNSAAWLAMANALSGHAEGTLSPAALYAFRQASAADPTSPGPPYFLGLAMARSGKLDEARALWAALLARSPANAPWRPELADKLARLDKMMAEMQKTAPPGP